MKRERVRSRKGRESVGQQGWEQGGSRCRLPHPEESHRCEQEPQAAEGRGERSAWAALSRAEGGMQGGQEPLAADPPSSALKQERGHAQTLQATPRPRICPPCVCGSCPGSLVALQLGMHQNCPASASLRRCL